MTKYQAFEYQKWKELNTQHTIKDDFCNWLYDILWNDNFFSLIYGSFASETNTSKSDLDVVIWTPQFNKKTFKNLRDFVIEIHKKHNLCLDNEVPYETKLLVPYDTFDKASKLSGLPLQNNIIKIPRILKTKDFLASEQVRSRLLFNMLTIPTISSWTDIEELNKMKLEAEKNLVLLGLHLFWKKKITIEDFLWTLLKADDWREWEFFLWYKNNLKVVEYLKDIFIKQIYELKELKILQDDKPDTFLIDQKKVITELKRNKSKFIY